MVKRYSVIIALLFVALIGTGIYGYNMYKDRNSYKIYLQNQYTRNLYDLISDVNNLEVSLSKVLVSKSREQGNILYGDIWRLSRSANDKVASLPVHRNGMSSIGKFLSQLSDFSYAMLKTGSPAGKTTDAQFSSIQKLKDYCGYISMQLNDFVSNVGYKGVTFEDLTQKAPNDINNNNNNFNVVFQNMSDQIQQYPTLIYDGPFSENVLNIKPKVISQKKISLNEAEGIIYKLFSKAAIDKIEFKNNMNTAKIPTYSFNIKLKGRSSNVNLDITKNGGNIYYMLDNRDILNEKLSIKDATKLGMKFLKNINFPNMIPTYTLKYDGIAVINYVSVKDKVLLYPDQIKLKVALDNGDIIGIQSQQYLTAHYERNIPKPKLTVKEAEARVNNRLKINNIRLTIIPMESLREVFCYEFFGDYDGEKYFVYINADDGSETRILKVINTYKGELTM